MEKVNDIKEGRNMEDMSPVELLIVMIGVSLLFIPYLIMNLFDVVNETTEYERRCVDV